MSKSTSAACRLLAIAVLLGLAGLGELTQALGATAQTRQASNHQASTQPAASAQQTSVQRAPAKPKRFSGFFTPPGRAMPKDSEGGASRGHCPQNQTGSQKTVTLLTPEGNSGLTLSAHPSFMAHVNKTAAKQIFFSLKNQDESYFFEMTTSLNQDELGLVTFQLPKTAPALVPGEQYRWSVAVICGNKLGPDSPWASGWIERVEVAEADQVQALPPLQQASYYGEAGFWYDAVESLARYRKNSQSAEARDAWSRLMRDGGLDLLPQPEQSLASR